MIIAKNNAAILHAEADNGSGDGAVQGLDFLVGLLQLLPLFLIAVIKGENQSTDDDYQNEGKASGLINLGARLGCNQLIGHGHG